MDRDGKFNDSISEVRLDPKGNVVIDYVSESRLSFIEDNQWICNLVLLKHKGRLEAATYRDLTTFVPLFWSAGGIGQRTFADYWDEAVLYADGLIARHISGEIFNADWYDDGFRDITDPILGDASRLVYLTRSSLKFVERLPQNLSFCFEGE